MFCSCQCDIHSPHITLKTNALATSRPDTRKYNNVGLATLESVNGIIFNKSFIVRAEATGKCAAQECRLL